MRTSVQFSHLFESCQFQYIRALEPQVIPLFLFFIVNIFNHVLHGQYLLQLFLMQTMGCYSFEEKDYIMSSSSVNTLTTGIFLKNDSGPFKFFF